jgi:hypothetical protein
VSVQAETMFNHITLLPGQLVQPMTQQSFRCHISVFGFRVPAFHIRDRIEHRPL